MRPITIRKPTFHFEGLPKHWLMNSPFGTHLANSLNLVFPAGERFFIRSVRHFADRIEDPVLREQVKGFMGQEVRHGMEHERFFEVLESQGFEIRSFLAWYERLAFEKLEHRVPPELRLSITVALEHFTAMFAERALTHDVLDKGAPKVMRDLLLWHACEELEHKSVAFDVLKRVNPSYALRVAGGVAAASAFVFFWLSGARHLMKQEPRGAPSREELKGAREHNVLLNGEFLGAFLEYLRPDFHPDQKDNYHLATRWLEANAASIAPS
jgi:predicted metal-dependent hydrolase